MAFDDYIASGKLTVATSNPNPFARSGPLAAMEAFPNPNVAIDVQVFDHHQMNVDMGGLLASSNADLFAQYAGFKNRQFAREGLLSDVSDVWAEVDGLPDGFRVAATADDGRQYFLPTSCYVWAVHYSRRLFEKNGYSIPTTGDELLALGEQMMSDGVTPFVGANDGQWPSMGTFDLLNMRTNGYDFHIDLLAGRESWTDERVRPVFDTWATLIPFHQSGANRRPWHEGAQSIQDGTAGMFLIGTFVASYSDELADDIDFFNFPALDPVIGATSLDAPTDGYQLVANPKNPAAAKELLHFLSTAASQGQHFRGEFLQRDPVAVASNAGVDTRGHTRLRRRSLELTSAATELASFFDRDTHHDFAPLCGQAFAKFIEDPSSIDAGLDELARSWQAMEEQ